MTTSFKIDGEGKVTSDSANNFLESFSKGPITKRSLYIEVYIGGMLVNQAVFTDSATMVSLISHPVGKPHFKLNLNVKNEADLYKAIPAFKLFGGYYTARSYTVEIKFTTINPFSMPISNIFFELSSLKREIIFYDDSLIFKMIFDQTEENITFIKNWTNQSHEFSI